MTEPGRRERGLRASFPAAYDTRPRGSALGELLDTLAGGLGHLDDAIESVMRNHWVRLAHEDSPAGMADPALTQLGRLVGAVPQPDEPRERFRRRMLAQARILREGVATPRSLLGLAATALGLELCGKLDRPAPSGGARYTIGHALRPGSVAACGGRCRRVDECPRLANRAAELVLIDNPPDLRSRRLRGVKRGDVLEIESESLEDAEPVLRLSVPKDSLAVAWPCLERGEETLFYADTLQPGEALVITPVRPGDPRSGTAVLHAAGGAVRPLGDGAVVYFTTGARFQPDDCATPSGAVFADEDVGPHDKVTRFARFGEATSLRTPLIASGVTRWSVSQVERKQLTDMLGADEVARRFPAAPETATVAAFDLDLEWVSYPAATFQLRIARNAAVRAAEKHGAIALIQELVELARGAGIAAWVDFPQEQELREHGPAGDDARWTLALAADLHESHELAATLSLATGLALSERPEQADVMRVGDELAYPLFAGLFAADDMAIGTRFNTSHFAPEDG